MDIPNNLYDAALACLMATDPDQKHKLTNATADAWRQGRLVRDEADKPHAIEVPGRPDRPLLVDPARVPRRHLNSDEGRAALLHAIAHIEFNAINLAWDAVYRFRDMPDAYYDGWIRVADEEAYHFSLLRERLRDFGHEYGDFDAHNGLWEMACKTDDDVMIRMALVPRVLEARGLDVTPGIRKKLEDSGDDRTVAILDIILRDEIGHVAIGTRWFRYACEQRGLDPEKTFTELLEKHTKGLVREPFFEEARMDAGFTEAEMQDLKRLARAGRKQ